MQYLIYENQLLLFLFLEIQFSTINCKMANNNHNKRKQVVEIFVIIVGAQMH
jgi:hypothetical protein